MIQKNQCPRDFGRISCPIIVTLKIRQTPIVPTTGSAIHWINHYLEEKRHQINKYIYKFTFSWEERIQKSAQLLEGQRN